MGDSPKGHPCASPVARYTARSAYLPAEGPNPAGRELLLLLEATVMDRDIIATQIAELEKLIAAQARHPGWAFLLWVWVPRLARLRRLWEP